MDRTVYCRDGRRERQCFNDNGRGNVCCLPFGHAGGCKFTCRDYTNADQRRAAEASKEPKGDHFKRWTNAQRN